MEDLNYFREQSPATPALESPVTSQTGANFEEKQRKTQLQVDEAFLLLDEAEKCIQKGDRDSAINNYNQAINIFNKTGWQDQTHYLYAAITRLQEEKIKTEEAAFLANSPSSIQLIMSSENIAENKFGGGKPDFASANRCRTCDPA